MKYEVIATLGPATAGPGTATQLLRAGATRFRLNTSHMTPEELHLRLQALEAELGHALPEVVLDLQGSKWRLGRLESRQLSKGTVLRLRLGQEVPPSGTAEPAECVLPVPHSDFFTAAAGSPGIVRLNDARVELQIESCTENELLCRVVRAGPVGPRKGISLPGSEFRVERLSAKDNTILTQTAQHPKVAYAVSYIRDREELRRIRTAFPAGHRLIAKIERPEAMADAGSLACECDELWICRGDLGAEMGLGAMALAVHDLAARVRTLGVPVVLAGQVLEHMSSDPEPTRSEVCHLYDAVAAGYAGFVLSDETAIGAYPAAACRAAAMFLGADRHAE